MSALVVQGAAALAIVGALVAARRVLRTRAGVGQARPSLQVSERCALARDTGVAVVSWNGRELLVGYGTSGVTLIWTNDPLNLELES